MCNENTEENKQDIEEHDVYCLASSLELLLMSIPLLQNGPSNGQLSASLVREPLITALLEGHFSKVCVKEIKYPIIYLPEKWYWCGIHLITCQIHFRKEAVQVHHFLRM